MKMTFWKVYRDAGAGEKGGGSPEIKEVTDAVTEFKTEQKKALETVKLTAEEAKQAAENAKKESGEIKTGIDELKAWQVKKDEADKANQEVINEYLKKSQGIKMKDGEDNGSPLGDLLIKALESKERQAELKAFSEKKKTELVIDLKEVGDMTFASSFNTANVSVASQRSGIIALPNRKMHVRQLVPTGTMDGSTFVYLKEVTGEGAPAAWAEGSGAKSQFDLNLVEADAKSEYIAGWLRMSRKLLDDVKGMASYLNMRLPELLLKSEDAQLIAGNGTSPNLSGITNAGNFVAADTTEAVAIDRLIDSISQLEELDRDANGIFVRPKFYGTLFKNKAAGSGEYDLPSNVTFSNGTLYVGGVPVFASTAAADNQFIVGDWKAGAQLLVREAPSIVFAYEDGTNIRENKVTVRIEERIAFPIYGDNYFVVGDLNPEEA